MAKEYVTFKSALRSLVPAWLNRDTGGAIVFTFGVHMNLLIEATLSAVKRQFPGTGGRADALPVIGRERGIRRGALETDEQYSARLLPWLYDHQRKGNPYMLLKQLFGFFAGNHFQIDLIYANGTRFIMAPDGTITRDTIVWSAGADVDWAKWWIFYHTEPSNYTPDWLPVLREWGPKGARHTQGLLHIKGVAGELWDYPQPVGTWNDHASDTWDDGHDPSDMLKVEIE